MDKPVPKKMEMKSYLSKKTLEILKAKTTNSSTRSMSQRSFRSSKQSLPSFSVKTGSTYKQAKSNLPRNLKTPTQSSKSTKSDKYTPVL